MSADRRGTALCLALLLVVAGCSGIPVGTGSDGGGAGAGEGTRVTVVEVVDGDTMEVEYPDGSRETVRLLGVDSPEVTARNEPGEFEGVPDTPAARECLLSWGDRASAFAVERLAGERVSISFDPAADRRGSYGRLLVYLRPIGANETFNRLLLERGLARVYDGPFTRHAEYLRVEAAARRNGVGLWGCANGSAAPTAGVSIVEIHPDAPGNDHENPNGEYVVLGNGGSEAVNLTGWTVSDAAGHTYRFPDGATLAPDASVTLLTGAGTDNATHRYWGLSDAVWNNGGDTVTVRNRSGAVVARRDY